MKIKAYRREAFAKQDELVHTNTRLRNKRAG